MFKVLGTTLFCLILCVGATFAKVDDLCTTQKTQVVIIGTIHSAHYENPDYRPEKLKEIILSLKPDVILNELPLSQVDPNNRPLFRDRQKHPEGWAADTVAQQLGIKQIPFDRPDRQENFRKTKYFEKQKKANELRKKCGNCLLQNEPNSLNIKIAQLQGYAGQAEGSLFRNAKPEVINSEAHDSIIRIKKSLWYEIIPEILEKYPQCKELIEFDHFFRDQWEIRNKIMADNIVKATKEYPGKRLLVITGATHRYILRDLLKDNPNIDLKEYWEAAGAATPTLFSETLYVDSHKGSDVNPGTQEMPLLTISKAAAIVNSKTKAEPTTIRIGPGIYNLTNSVIFEDSHQYTEKDRLIIEASILPDDPQWKPSLMPVILSTENPGISEKLTETYGLKMKRSYVTIRGLRFLGNPVSNNWHACIERTGKDLDDLLITQCEFIGDKDSFNIYCAAIASGSRFVVDHCIFRNCHASVVYWDGLEDIGGKGCAMRYSIVDGGLISGVWTCQTAEDFEFHHNIVTNCDYFWIRKPGDQITYKLHDCIITNNKHYSGYGVATGATGQTGTEVTHIENDIVKAGQIVFGKDKSKNSYLHVVPGTFGSDFGAGLFTKPASEKKQER